MPRLPAFFVLPVQRLPPFTFPLLQANACAEHDLLQRQFAVPSSSSVAAVSDSILANFGSSALQAEVLFQALHHVARRSAFRHPSRVDHRSGGKGESHSVSAPLALLY